MQHHNPHREKNFFCTKRKEEMEVTDSQIRDQQVEELLRQDNGGFSFDLTSRNQRIIQQLGGEASALPKAWSTGTTICGINIKDGIVLGADTRATGGSEVMDKNCEKIHYLAPNIWCCGAGTAADTEKTTELIASNLELLRLSNGSQSRVVTALTLLKRMLHKSVVPLPLQCLTVSSCLGIKVMSVLLSS
jgi:20S proteasome alpha/beta subunit